MINKNLLIQWLHNQIERELSCCEDMEMTECEEYLWGRGKIAAWEQLLKMLTKGD